MMEPNDWRALVDHAPAGAIQLAPAAPEARIDGLERLVGRSLPAAYRSLLLVGDGGRIGRTEYLGTTKLIPMLQRAIRLRQEGRFCSLDEERQLLLPFHRVDANSYECLDLEHQGAVRWACFEASDLARARREFDAVPGIAYWLLTWQGPCRPEVETTYGDFTDWVLDGIMELHFPSLPISSHG